MAEVPDELIDQLAQAIEFLSKKIEQLEARGLCDPAIVARLTDERFRTVSRG